MAAASKAADIESEQQGMSAASLLGADMLSCPKRAAERVCGAACVLPCRFTYCFTAKSEQQRGCVALLTYCLAALLTALLA